MAGYLCPFCGQKMSLHEGTASGQRIFFNGNGRGYSWSAGTKLEPSIEVEFYKCPNDDCKKTSIIIHRVENSKFVQTIVFHPRVPEVDIPNCIPEKILEDFKEARLILDDSPKAAATLCRRCLQSMIRDFYGIKKKTLNQEITALKDILRPDEWEVIDGIRKIGNLGAHLDDDVNLIVDLNKDDAQTLIDTVYYLFDEWYVSRQKREERHAKITGKVDDIDEAKGLKTAKHPASSPTAPPPKGP